MLDTTGDSGNNRDFFFFCLRGYLDKGRKSDTFQDRKSPLCPLLQ